MIRANLLPRSRRKLRIVNVDVDVALAREAILSCAIVGCIVAGAFVFGILSLASAVDASAAVATETANDAPNRERARKLLLEIARYQQFERRRAQLRGTGADAARAIASIGNHIPRDVRIEDLDRASSGYEMHGVAVDVDGVARTIARLNGVSAGARSSLVSIDDRDPERGRLRFDAVVGDAARASP